MTYLMAIGVGTLCFGAAFAITKWIRSYALRTDLLDVPNARSSHTQPTPRSGGIAIASVSLLGFAVLYFTRVLDQDLFYALLVGGGAIALVGYIDDRRHLSAKVRLLVHLGAALWGLLWLGMGEIGTEEFAAPSWFSYLLGMIGIAWLLNLFNFMDGIDGIAASEAAFVTLSGVLLAVVGGKDTGVAAAAFVLGTACLGFLAWNWPPAKIFMGDVGSGYIGFVIALLTIAAGRGDPSSLLAWLILSGVFVTDATVTLLRRLLRGERVYQAHRSHGYQWLARRWSSHKRVTVAVILINFAWLLPCAVAALLWPHAAPVIAIAAFSPLIALALGVGSGRPEAEPR